MRTVLGQLWYWARTASSPVVSRAPGIAVQNDFPRWCDEAARLSSVRLFATSRLSRFGRSKLCRRRRLAVLLTTARREFSCELYLNALIVFCSDLILQNA